MGMGRPPLPLIRAMPERKRFFSIDPFPYLNSAIALLLGMVNLLTDAFFHAGPEVVVWVGVATV